MKKCYSIFGIIFLLVAALHAQPDYGVEAGYLNHINQQGDRYLLRDNLPTALMMANKALFCEGDEQAKAVFFAELAECMDILDREAEAFYFTIYPVLLYSSDSLQAMLKPVFIDRAGSAGLNREKANRYYDQAVSASDDEIRERLTKLAELGAFLYLDELDAYILTAGQRLSQSGKVPRWYEHWRVMAKVGLKAKDKQEFMDARSADQPDIYSVDKGGASHRLYRKSIRYYAREDADEYANNLAQKYRKKYPGIRSLFCSAMICFY